MSVTTSDRGVVGNVWVVLGLGVLIVLVGGGVAVWQLVVLQEQRFVQRGVVDVLHEKLFGLGVSRDDLVSGVTSADLTTPENPDLGGVPARVSRDRVSIESLVGMLFTWDSTASYENIRQTLMGEYGLSAGDAMLVDFFPEAPVFVDEYDGKELQYIEMMGLNSSLVEVLVYPTGVVGSEYEYVAIAGVASETGGERAMRVNMLHFTTGEDGSFSGMRGWASLSPTLFG